MTYPSLQLSSLGAPPPVPDHSGWDPVLRATLHTGANAVEAVSTAVSTFDRRPVALDIEAAGLGARAFTMRCVTAAWEAGDGTHSVLLDPRRDDHAAAVRSLAAWATALVLHNSPYDVPPLVAYGLVEPDQLAKVWDTVVAARMAYPDRTVSKGLQALATRDDVLGMKDTDVTMATAFKAAGHRTQEVGWQTMDVDAPVYRLGAMADTVVTLRLGPVLVDRVVAWLTSNTFDSPAVPDRDRALELLEREQTTNRVMLRTSARGLLVDQDYLATYTADHQAALESASAGLTEAGLDPLAGNLGAKLVEYLADRDQLPAGWPMTATGKRKADKAAMALLDDHPLAVAHRQVADLSKVTGYLEKVQEYAGVTGRIHPQVNVLGASATGRMAYREPELQQFPGPARPILVPDPGREWVSIDWSSIEPVVVANCAGDRDFLAGFNDHGADLYAPIVAAADVDRKVAKVVLLAAMYGQGIALLASNLGVTEDQARDLQRRVFAAMPATRRFLDALRTTGDSKGATMTADGRYLPVPTDPAGRVMGYKATNYFTQGTAYSVLSEAVNTLEANGLGEAIYLAMHDELVVDAEAAEDVRKVMETAPPWLEAFSGAPVVLRTDANPLPGHWAYV